MKQARSPWLMVLVWIGLGFAPRFATAAATIGWQQALTTGPDWARVATLLGFGQDPNVVRETDGRNALSIAAEQGRGTEIRLLLSRGARVARSAREIGAFDWAVRRGMAEERELLFAAMTPLERKQDLFAAMLRGEENVALELLRLGVPADTVFLTAPVAHLAARKGLNTLLRALIAAKSPLTGLSDQKLNPLQEAFYTTSDGRRVETVGILLEAGLSPDHSDPSVNPPLVQAVEWRRTAIVARLLEAGASVSARSVSRGCKPLRCLLTDEKPFSPGIAWSLIQAAFKQRRWPL